MSRKKWLKTLGLASLVVAAGPHAIGLAAKVYAVRTGYELGVALTGPKPHKGTKKVCAKLYTHALFAAQDAKKILDDLGTLKKRKESNANEHKQSS